ncbi:hypothetical protein PHMEG_00040266 [Phytophthora megakarya]|uniref:Uncharacterized protein n=1 Tax=Phytophthora megakarya TaxID=4795 RepID=A0A225UE96_9STRA|nr:hypothetical protein PHMEG_00040266 [Phytophthora megakarya]
MHHSQLSFRPVVIIHLTSLPPSLVEPQRSWRVIPKSPRTSPIHR